MLANLKKRKKDKEVADEGEVILLDKGVPSKLPKTNKGKGRAFFVESKEAEPLVEVHPLIQVWNRKLEMDGVAIPWNSSIREFQRGNAHYVANTLVEGHDCLKECEAIGSLPILEEGLSSSKLLIMSS